MTNAWWDRGDRGAVTPQGIAVRASAAFTGVLLAMAISWPVGIGLALVVCVAATVVANRMLEAAEAPLAERVPDLTALLGVLEGEPA